MASGATEISSEQAMALISILKAMLFSPASSPSLLSS
jgi:hypothetical protein